MTRRGTARIAASAAAAALALLVQHAAFAAPPEFYRIVTSPGSYETPNGVSPDGSIVITTEHVWTPAGGLIPFAPGVGTYSRDVSNTGVVVGLTDGDYNAFLTRIGGPVQRLGSGDAFGITPDGHVVVGYAYINDSPQAFRWTASTGLVGLGHLPSGVVGHEQANGVSADGSVVVGLAEGPEGPQAFRWTAATGMAGLGDLPGGEFNSSATAVSGDGRVVVGYSTGAAGTEAFHWTEAGGMAGLGDLPGGLFNSVANAASFDGGVVVGSAHSAGGRTAFLWTEAAGMRSLRDVLVNDHGLGAALESFTPVEAADVSADGRVIVGYGTSRSGATEGFVVIIPEPSAAAPPLAALALLARRRGRRRGRRPR